jgi:C4-dicarboxylate-specific signal transduction histidine kinase
VRYRAPSLWQAYRRTVLSALAVLALQSLLIVGLLYQRRARHRAEGDSRRNLALAADVSRRATMSAMTSSIEHELGQPLGSILHNAQALQMVVTENRATPDTMGEILSDIQTQGVRVTQIIDRHRTMLKSRQLDKKRIDLRAVIDETLVLVAHDLSARQVEATVDLSSRQCVIDGDQVLLQQVFVNLVMNAMDAMAEPPRPGVTSRSAATSGPPMSTSPCATRGLACQHTSSTRCSPPSSRPKRAASGSA